MVGVDVPAARVQEVIEQHPLVAHATLFDVYAGEQLGADVRSLAYRVSLQARDRTLTAEDVQRAMDRLLSRLERELGAVQRQGNIGDIAATVEVPAVAGIDKKSRTMAEHHQHDDHHRHHEHHDAHHHHHSSHQEDMLSVEEALEKILSYVSPMAPVEVALPDALGLTLAEEVTSPFDLPPLDNSAMDGFAVRYEDVAGAGQHNPVELPVIGYVQAGALPDRDLEPGSAIRIMTGAPIPPGANAVVPFEDTDEVERKASGHALDRIRIMQEAPNGANVRPAGEDLRTGDRLMGPGVVLRPGEIGVLASVGRQRVTALRRPVVAILSTGDELLALGEAPGAGKIYDSNSFSIAARCVATAASRGCWASQRTPSKTRRASWPRASRRTCSSPPPVSPRATTTSSRTC